MAARLVTYGTGSDFDPIRPDERDLFSFDFTAPANGVTIASAVTACAVDPDSPQPDPTPASRVLATSTIAAGVVTNLIGTMVNGATYTLTSTATLADGRVLAFSADVECNLNPISATTLTPPRFRQDFPTFASAAAYPDEVIAFWINNVTTVSPLDPNNFPDGIVLVQELYVAHMLTLERQNQLAARRGQPALAVGPASSRSVGGVSVSYDLSAAYMQGAGFWNLTSYGQRYWYLINQAGAGPVQF